MTQRLPELLQTYLRFHSMEGSTPATIKFYRKELRLFLRFLEGQGHSMLVQDISALDIMVHLEEMKSRGLDPRSLRSRLQAISTFLTWAEQWEVIPANPARRIKHPKVPRTRKEFLSQEAFQSLLELCPLSTLVGARRQAMLWMFATTGMRRRELCLLQLEDLDWQRGTIRVVHGKGQKERRVPFLQEVQRPMLRYLPQRTDGLPCLWITEEGLQLSYDGMGRDMTRLFQRAEIQVKDVCHVFRRSWAANAVRQGIPRPYIQAIAGWSTPTMMDRYVEAMQAEEGAIEVFQEFRAFDTKPGN